MRSTITILLLAALCAPSAALRAAPKEVPTRTSAIFAKVWNRATFDHSLFDGLLRRFVRNGRVDYAGLKARRSTLDEYLYRIAETDPAGLRNVDERFAFYINAYNAITLRAVLDRLPADRSSWVRFSVTRVKGFWKGFAYKVGGRFISLDFLEHKILRPVFKRPRVHFAIVCASKGCPALASRAYRAGTLDAQLTAAARAFFRRRDALRVERSKMIVYLSPLLQWFKEDFRVQPYRHELEFVARFVDSGWASFLRAARERLTLRYLPYDWNLNLQ